MTDSGFVNNMLKHAKNTISSAYESRVNLVKDEMEVGFKGIKAISEDIRQIPDDETLHKLIVEHVQRMETRMQALSEIYLRLKAELIAFHNLSEERIQEYVANAEQGESLQEAINDHIQRFKSIGNVQPPELLEKFNHECSNILSFLHAPKPPSIKQEPNDD